MGYDLVSALSKDLREDAERLATGGSVPQEIERRTVGRIGLLVCEISRGLWTREDLVRVAAEAANKAVSEHAVACAASWGAGGRMSVVLFVDRYFRHIWWGLVILCCVFGIREVVDALVGAARAMGG